MRPLTDLQREALELLAADPSASCTWMTPTGSDARDDGTTYVRVQAALARSLQQRGLIDVDHGLVKNAEGRFSPSCGWDRSCLSLTDAGREALAAATERVSA